MCNVWCDLDLTFDLVVVTFSLKILSGLYLRNRKLWEVDTWQGHYLGVRCATSRCDFDLTFDLTVVTLTFKVLSSLYLGNLKV